MSEEIAASSSPMVAGLPWHQVWLRAITRPSVATFEELVRDPKASPGRAYTWVFLTALIVFLVTALLINLMPGLLRTSLPAELGRTEISALDPSPMICIAPIYAVFTLLGFMLLAGITHGISRALGGTGSYASLVYALASFQAPLFLIGYFLGSTPYIKCLTPLLGLYILVLIVMAVKAVHGFGWGKAVVSPFIVPGILSLCSVLVIVTLAILGSNVSQ